MELNEYQKQAMKTCLKESENFSYMMLNLVGEMGEIASKIGKAIRKEQLVIMHNHLIPADASSDIKDMDLINETKKEAGDVLWQLSGLCSVMGWSLEEVAQQNLEKLDDRQKRGVIASDGDNR